MDLTDYIANKHGKTHLAIYNNRLYRVDISNCKYYKFYDYFTLSDIPEFTVDHNKYTLTIWDSNHSEEMRKHLYTERNIIWLKDDLDDHTIQRIHLRLLKKIYEEYNSKKYSREKILHDEILYKTNILEAYDKLHNKVSQTLYDSVKSGHTDAVFDYTLVETVLTKTFYSKIDFTVPNSDGRVRSSLETYVPFLLRDELKRHGLEYDESIGQELVETVIKKELSALFPHLTISRVGLYKFRVTIPEVENNILL